MIRPVLQYPHPALAKPTVPFTDEEFAAGETYELDMHLVETLTAMPNGLGLAAPQIGIHRSAFGLKTPRGVVCFFNPVVVAKGPMKMGNEACLSFSSLSWPVPSPEWVELEWRDSNGKLSRDRDDGGIGQAVFHETEHLSGKTMIDRMGKLSRREFLKALAKRRAA